MLLSLVSPNQGAIAHLEDPTQSPDTWCRLKTFLKKVTQDDAKLTI